jgi:hypothetical protein
MVLASKTKTPSIHDKKRRGQHHKVTKSYHKTYWPYLPLVVIIGLGIGVNSLWAHSSHGVLGYATDMSASELLADTNAQRTSNSEGTLNLNTELDNAAQAKANNMVALNYWSHDTPSGQPPWVFITAAGYNYSVAGENLAYGFNTSQDVITAWMASPEHRANILDAQYKDVGFGIANATNYQNSGPETVIVAEYGAPAAVATTQATATSTPTGTSIPAPVAPTAKATTPPSTVQQKATPLSTPVALDEAPVSRMQLASDNAIPVSAFSVSMLAVLCFAVLFIRHGLIWRRVLIEGEAFAVRYHALDVLFVTIGVIGFIITRNAGFIH